MEGDSGGWRGSWGFSGGFRGEKGQESLSVLLECNTNVNFSHGVNILSLCSRLQGFRIYCQSS